LTNKKKKIEVKIKEKSNDKMRSIKENGKPSIKDRVKEEEIIM